MWELCLSYCVDYLLLWNAELCLYHVLLLKMFNKNQMARNASENLREKGELLEFYVFCYNKHRIASWVVAHRNAVWSIG